MNSSTRFFPDSLPSRSISHFLLACCLSIGLGRHAHAIDVFWRNENGGAFTNAGNWFGGLVPSLTDVAHGAGSTGIYTLSGIGQHIAGQSEHIGYGGNGTFNHLGANTLNAGVLMMGSLASGVDYCTTLSMAPMFLGACRAGCAQRASRAVLNIRIRSRAPSDSIRRPARSACTTSRSTPDGTPSIAPATGITE